MTPGTERDERGQSPEGDDYVRQQLASIDGNLFNGMPSDDRFESGVPEGQRGNSLDFIQMTGLTRPPLRTVSHGVDGALAQVPLYDDLNPTQPLSFYEKGVADVDDTLGYDMPHGGLRDAILDSDLVPNRVAETLVSDLGPSRSAQAFRDIVAGLQRTDTAEELEVAAEEAPEDSHETPPDSVMVDHDESEEMSTSAALLAMMEEIESAMGAAPEPDENAPADQEAPESADPVVAGAPAAEIGDDDFDALLASLSERGDQEAEPSSEPATDREASSIPPSAPVEPVEVAEPEPESDLTEDWDSLLDAMSVRGSEPESSSEPSPTPVHKTPAHGALAEAEQLMQALEKRPQHTSPVTVAASAAPPDEPVDTHNTIAEVPSTPSRVSAGLLGPVVPEDSGGDQTLGYDFDAAPSRRRSRRHSRVARRSLKLLKTFFYIALIGGLAATVWIYIAGPMLLQDEDLSARAERLMTARDYSAASQTYLQLASRIAPGETERSNAEFRAAYALTLGPETSGDDTKRRYGTAVSLFKKFTEDYPQHPKRARALSLMGRLHFELQEFEQAITVLRDQVKPVDDPAAALTMLRYLARAYSMTGKYEEAETAYLQAATLPGNYNAEADYLEMGDLFRQRAGLENDPGARKPLEDMAMSYWRRALQVPGLAPGDRNTLEERLQWLTYTEENAVTRGADASSAAPAVDPALSSTTEPVVESPVPAPPVSPIPVATDETGRAEVPGAELEALAPPVQQAVQ